MIYHLLEFITSKTFKKIQWYIIRLLFIPLKLLKNILSTINTVILGLVKFAQRLLIPLMISASIYAIFHTYIDNFIYYFSENYLNNGIIGFYILSGWTVYLFITYLRLELSIREKKEFNYRWLQKIRQFNFYLKVGLVLLSLILSWFLLQWIFINKYNDYKLYYIYYKIISGTYTVFLIIYCRIDHLIKPNNTNNSKTNNLKNDSLLDVVKIIENRDDNNDSFLKARNKIKKLISDLHIQSTFSKHYTKDECSNIIGIDGEWGSGKTTLIELVKRKIPSDVCVVEFNPWMNHQPQNLTANFFKTLSTSIGSYTMRRSMVRYGIALSKVAKKDIGDALEFVYQEPSLETQFSNICEYIKSTKLKLLIIIDDIDRMDGDEILSILKLARITGNLPNAIYLLAFSHRYVKAQIDQKIRTTVDNDSFNYIDKIVNHPFKMPKYTPGYLYNELQNDLKKISREYQIGQLNIIKHYLTNFRVYNKLYNTVFLDYENYKSQIHLEDFIVLKTLQNCHIELYNILIESIKETTLKINTERTPQTSFERAKLLSPNLFSGNNISNENELILFILKNKAKKKEIYFNEDLISEYITRNTSYNKYVRKRLIISALKIDENSYENNLFDSLDFSIENIGNINDNKIKETTLDGYLKSKNYTWEESLFVSDILFNETKPIPRDKNEYIKGLLYSIFLEVSFLKDYMVNDDKCSRIWFTITEQYEFMNFDVFLKNIEIYSIYFRDESTYNNIFEPLQLENKVGHTIYLQHKNEINELIMKLDNHFKTIKMDEFEFNWNAFNPRGSTQFASSSNRGN